MLAPISNWNSKCRLNSVFTTYLTQNYFLFISYLMSTEERSLEHKRTLVSLNKALGSTTPIQPEPFPKLQRSRRVCSNLDMTPQNLVGQTWDPVHLDKLLRQANSSGNIQSNKQSSFDLQEVPQIKNASLYGYTNIFPLVHPDRSNKSIIHEQKSENLDIKKPINQDYFIPSKAKPMGPKETIQKLMSLKKQINSYHQMKANKSKQIRLRHLLANQYRHGVIGYENPQSTDKEFSDNFIQEPALNPEKRMIAKQNYDKYVKSYLFSALEGQPSFPRETYELSPVMKRKGRAFSVQQMQPEEKSSMKTFNRNERNFDIISNRLLD